MCMLYVASKKVKANSHLATVSLLLQLECFRVCCFLSKNTQLSCDIASMETDKQTFRDLRSAWHCLSSALFSVGMERGHKHTHESVVMTTECHMTSEDTIDRCNSTYVVGSIWITGYTQFLCVAEVSKVIY
jgi:hypothetical protein